MTYVGAPMLYYGDEAGIWGANDPDCRKPMLWDELEYEDEATRFDGSKKTEPDRVAVDHELLGHYKKLIALRNELPALRRGSFETVLIDDDRQLYGFRRQLDGQEILVVLNNTTEPQQTKLPAEGEWTDRWNGGTTLATENNQLPLEVAPKGAAILVRNR
jgi:glycosidase